MLIFESDEARKEYIHNKAEKLRRAAGMIKDIKPIVRKFDGKVYNKRFDEAIEALTNDNMCLSCSISFDNFTIRAYPPRCYSDDISLFWTKAAKAGEELAAFTDHKRIKADYITDKLNDKHGELMRKAYIFEETARNLDNIKNQIDTLKKQYNIIWDMIPGELHEVFNIKPLY